MEWIKIDEDNLPKKEVLAANFKAGTFGYKEKCIGYFHISDNVICENNNELLGNCTHYIDINGYDIKVKTYEDYERDENGCLLSPCCAKILNPDNMICPNPKCREHC